MTPKEAADKLRPSFHLEQMPTDARHHVAFVEAVASELDVEPTAFNLHQVADALDEAGIHGDMHEFPMMLYSRRHHAIPGVAASVYLPRHDAVFAHVDSEEQAKSLGSGWFENLSDLPPRGEDEPIDAVKEKIEEHHEEKTEDTAVV